MEKRNLNNERDVKKSNSEERKNRNSSKSNQINQKRLPWWVELLFVQIGLPDKWLIKILKSKKNALVFYEERKKYILLTFIFLFTLGYFQPLIRDSNSKLKCQKLAYNFIKEINLFKSENIEMLEMLSVNYCNGGNEIEYLRQVE
tara:strand:- start:130 stop:564 length:435 start_codon:yes stop_codon:yes gene_type:complete